MGQFDDLGRPYPTLAGLGKSDDSSLFGLGAGVDGGRDFLSLLGQTWPARTAKDAIAALLLPGDVYAGRIDPMSDEGIKKATGLAGLMMGAPLGGAPSGALGSGAVRPAIRDIAEQLGTKLEDLGLNAKTTHWGSDVGQSSYVTPQYVDPFGRRHTFPEVRVSDHAVGPARAAQHLHVQKPSDIDSVLGTIQGRLGPINEKASQLQSTYDAVASNQELMTEIAKLPKDTSRAFKMMKEAGIPSTIDDATVILRKMREGGLI